MSKTIETTVYEFAELSDAAKEKVREWWRECESEEFGAFGDLYEPFETAAKLLGIELKMHDITLMSGKTRAEPRIYWQLHVQGSGASFEGRYQYAKQAARAIRAEFGTESDTAKTLLGIAESLAELQRKYFYQLTAVVTTSGMAVHEYAMGLEAFDRNGKQVDSADEEALLKIMRDFARWIYRSIAAEYDYRMSDEQVDDSIIANEYTFTADGRRF